MAAKNNSKTLTLTRVYDAPVKAVWDAWTDTEQVAKWWGPRGFTLTTHSKDLRPGGHWSYTMHGPDGTDYVNKTKYFEVEKYAKLVYDHGGNEDIDRAPMFRVVATFEEVKGGKTKMVMSMTLATVEAANEAAKFIKKANGHSTWDRLAEYLEKEASGKEKFVINRVFEAPQAKLYDVWTDPKHIAKWLPPTGFKMEYLKADIRPGGSASYVMWNDSGLKMYGSADYIELSRPDRIVYTQQFTDEKGNISRHPMAPTWPAVMKTVITFAEESPDSTRVTVEWEVHGKYTPEEMQTFIGARTGMMGGWTGSFDKLEEYLELA